MIRYIRDLRLIPIALIASACLLALKTADLVFHGSSLFAHHNAAPDSGEVAVIHPMPDATAPPGSKLSWAQQMFNFPSGNGAVPLPSPAPIAQPQQLARIDNGDITGSVNAPAEDKDKAALDAKTNPEVNDKDARPMPGGGVLISSNGASLPTGAERAILERLQERRQELDSRSRELDIRESLIKDAEKRMDAKLTELKDVEAHIKVETQQKDEAETARLKGLVSMYENMKPRDAAKIFNGLDTGVLMQVVSQINPRQMADILAQMSPDVAQHLTVELANKAQAVQSDSPNALPKIQGQAIAQ